MTTRGDNNMSDPLTSFMKKLKNASPAEITMNGDDVNDWDTTGLDPRATTGCLWRISIDEDNVVTWEKDDSDPVDYGDEFFLQGTANEWIPEPLDRDEDVPGLWKGTIMLDTKTGLDRFQIVGDASADMVYYPNVAFCSQKTATIQFGPCKEKDYCWCIEGQPGEHVKIEFFQSGSFRSVNWYKVDKPSS